MKLTRRIIALIMALIMTCFAIVACTPKDNNSDTGAGNNDGTQAGGKKYTLTVWGSKEDQTMLQEMCNAYAAANPQNTYKFLYGVLSESEAATKILGDPKSGPDVFCFANDQINSLISAGALARVGGEIEKNIKEVNTADSVDAATITVNGQDQLYAYPCTGDNCLFVYYDKSVYTDPSQIATLDGMLEGAKSAGKEVHFKLNDDGFYLSTFFFSNPNLKYNVTYDENMSETGVSINFNEAGGLPIMRSLVNYVNHDSLVIQTQDSDILGGFTEGTIASAVSGTWNAEALKEILGDRFGVAKLPTVKIDGQDTQLVSYMGYKLIGVNGYSENKGESHKLAQWLTNEENQQKRFDVRGFGPTNKNVVASESVQNDPVISVVMQQAQYSRPQKAVPGNYWTPMGALITSFIELKSSGTLLAITDEELQELLNNLVSQIAK